MGGGRSCQRREGRTAHQAVIWQREAAQHFCGVGGEKPALTQQRLLAGQGPEAMRSQEAATAQEGRER